MSYQCGLFCWPITVFHNVTNSPDEAFLVLFGLGLELATVEGVDNVGHLVLFEGLRVDHFVEGSQSHGQSVDIILVIQVVGMHQW